MSSYREHERYCEHEKRTKGCKVCDEKFVGKFKVGDVVDWTNSSHPEQKMEGLAVVRVSLGCECVSELTRYFLAGFPSCVEADELTLSKKGGEG